MNSATNASTDEIVLFEGDVTAMHSAINVEIGHGKVTPSCFRFASAKGQQEIRADQIANIEEKKHGFAKKLVLTLNEGQPLGFQAANHKGLHNALLAMTGKQEIESVFNAEPELKNVRNGSAWLAAFGPLITSVVVGFLGVILWGNPAHWSVRVQIAMVFMQLALIYLFMRIDHLMLQQQGFNPTKLGIARPENIFVYLFSRAKVFGHSNAYAIVWSALIGLDVLFRIVG